MNTLTTNDLSDQILLIDEVNKGRLIKVSEILYLKADDNYCKIFLEDNNKLFVSKSLKDFEKELNPDLFFRCHKSYLVNATHIKEYTNGKRGIIITLNDKDKTSVKVARRKAGKFKKFLQSQFYRQSH